MKRHILSLILVSCVCGIMQAQEIITIGDKAFYTDDIDRITFDYVEYTDGIGSLIANNDGLSIFATALQETGLADSLYNHYDPAYSVGSDSTNWTNPNLVFHMGAEYDNVAYPKTRQFNFTVFVEPDSVFGKYGIKSVADLKAYAQHVYDQVFPTDASVTDPTDRRNSLNRFVAYHILPFKAGYYQLTANDGYRLAQNFVRNREDITDWYATYMPQSMMKLSFPDGSESGLYINRRGVQSNPDWYGVFVRGVKVLAPEDYKETNESANGIYHIIDQVLTYDDKTQWEVLCDRMRIDCSTLSPDFMASGARGCKTRFTDDGGMYGTGDFDSSINNRQTCYGFKSGAAENFDFDDEYTHLHVRPRCLSFWSYQGDEVALKGEKFDVSVKLPPVPEGIWELRIGTCVGFEKRAAVQFYVDGVPVGIPVDFRPRGDELGWKKGNDFEFDKQWRNEGWMKGPDTYRSLYDNSFRELPYTLRRIIGTFYFDNNTDHYLRMVQVRQSDGEDVEFPFDYIELCPKTIYDNPDVIEDGWLYQ